MKAETSGYAGPPSGRRVLPLHVAAALVALAAGNAVAAPPEPPPVQTQTQSGGAARTGPGPVTPPAAVAVPPQKAPAAFPPREPEFPGIAWGSFLLYPEAALAATYDDNVYASRRQPVHDVVYTLSAALAGKSTWNRHALNFELGVDADRYASHSSEDVDDWWAGFDGRYDLSPTTNLFGGVRTARDHEDRSVPGAAQPSTQVEPTRYDHHEAHLGFATEWGALRLRAGGTWDEYDYRDGRNAAGATVDNDFRDHTLRSIGARLGYRLSAAWEPFIQYATDTRVYANRIPGHTFNRDSDGYRAAVGVAFNLTDAHLAGEAFYGRLRQDFDHAALGEVSEPYYGLLAVWKPDPRFTLTGFIDRSLEETTVYSGTRYASSSLDTTYGVELEHKLTGDLSATARAAYTRSRFQNFDRLDKVIDAGVGLRYYVTPTVYVGGDIRLIDRDSNDPVAQYTRNQFMLNLGWTGGRSRTYGAIPEAAAPAAGEGSSGGFYLGLAAGHGGLTTRTAGPRSGGGSDTGDMGNLGATHGVFAGFGMDLGRWYLGLEVDAYTSPARWYHRKDKDDARTMHVDKNTGYGLSLRAGYTLDGGLLYGRVGVARTDFHTYYTENQFAATGAFDKDHTERGRRLGVGLELPTAGPLFVRLDYAYTDYGRYDVTYQSTGGGATTTETFDLRDSVFSLGLGWRPGGAAAGERRDPASVRGFYAGAGFAHGALVTKLTGIHRDQGTGPYDFTGEFGAHGGGGAFFAGWGHTLGRVYLGLELEAQTAGTGWYHERQTGGGGGRDFSVERRGGYGGAVRAGYVLANGGLLYARVGEVRTRFTTIYNKGASSSHWIDRDDRLSGNRVGVGAEMPAFRKAYLRMDYSVTRYDDYGFVTTHDGGTNADAMKFDNRESLFVVGLGLRF